MARMEKIGAWGLTEPDHGSDSVMLETTARRDGRRVGHKRRETLDRQRHLRRPRHHLGARRRRRPGQSLRPREGRERRAPPRLLHRANKGQDGQTRRLAARHTLEDVCVPDENRLEGANSFKDTNKVLTATRSGVAWEAIGHAVAAYEAALQYAQERVQFGKPIASFQLIQNKLSGMLAEITNMQLMCFRLAQLQEQGKMTGPMASLAKMNNARKAKQVCSDARDIMGGNGVLLEYHVARHLSDMEIVYTYEGTDTIQSLIVGRDVTGIQRVCLGQVSGFRLR